MTLGDLVDCDDKIFLPIEAIVAKTSSRTSVVNLLFAYLQRAILCQLVTRNSRIWLIRSLFWMAVATVAFSYLPNNGTFTVNEHATAPDIIQTWEPT